MNGAAMYSETQNIDRNDLVLKHVVLVKRIAYHLLSRLPATVQLDDLIQAGIIGLIEAAKKFDSNQGAAFETYAGIRIRGAMFDEIRRHDWTPRSVHRKARQVSEVVREIENRTGRDARDQEVAEAMAISLQEYHQILQDSCNAKIFSLEELQESGERREFHRESESGDPAAGLQQNHFKGALAEAIDKLPERERLVVVLYYDEELNLREIGEVIGVSESRICQIHSQAMIRLRARLADWLNS